MDAPKTGEFAHIGKSVVIKGEVSGSEDLYVDGSVEGKIELRNHSLTVGPNGNVKADVVAKAVVIQGKLDGSVNASDRVELRKAAVVNGDVTTQRIAEFGVRMALGASPRSVLALVMRRAAQLTVLGVTVGLAFAFSMARVLNTLLFGLEATDAITYVAALLAVTPIVVLAAAIPAWRAARVDPVVALRNE